MSFLKNNIENENVLLILASNRAVDTYSLISMTPVWKRQLLSIFRIVSVQCLNVFFSPDEQSIFVDWLYEASLMVMFILRWITVFFHSFPKPLLSPITSAAFFLSRKWWKWVFFLCLGACWSRNNLLQQLVVSFTWE